MRHMTAGRPAAFLIVPALLALSPALASRSRAADKNPDLPQTMTVLGEKLDLKNKQPGPGEALVGEYIPAAETWENWTLMFAVRVFQAKRTPDQESQAKIGEIRARKAHGDLLANGTIYAKDSTRVADFLLSQDLIVEHNLIKYATIPDGRLASFQLAHRCYKTAKATADQEEADHDRLVAFITEIKTKRDVRLAEVERLSEGFLK